ncbi:MAG: sulfatase-like hydrolase/transferase [Pseudomonadota bacterium]
MGSWTLTLLSTLVLSACGSGGGESASSSVGGMPPPPVPQVDNEQVVDEDETGKEAPNIILIVGDDIAFDHYGFTGHPIVQTPTLDGLADVSIRYPNTYVASHCRPTQAGLLTGLPQHRHRVTYLVGPGLSRVTTLPDRLVNAGYASYQAGKFWEGEPDRYGFTDFMPFTSRTGALELGRRTIQPVLDFIAQTTSPWFIWFTPRMPHSPHRAPELYRSQYEDLGLNKETVEYYAMISWFDAVVADVLAAVGEQTVVIYLADNGYIQSPLPEIPARRSKVSLYERGVRTELLIRLPGEPAGLRPSPASVPDVVRTILSLAGAYWEDLPGRDLFSEPSEEARAFGSLWALQFIDSRRRLAARFARQGDTKLIDRRVGRDELYNLAADPNEHDNLIDDPDWFIVQSELRVALDHWWSR